MGRLILDITELAQWEGKLTGVPRVISELASRFYQAGDFHFVAWDNVGKSFNAVDFNPEASVDSGSLPSTDQSSPNQQLSGIIGLAKKAEQHSKIARGALSIPKKIRQKSVTRPGVKKQVGTFKILDDDTLFVFADWHGSDPAFANRLVDLKSRGVALAQISYDLLPIVTPQYSGHATQSFTNYVNKVYPICNLIFSISKNTQQDISNYLSAKGLSVPPIKTFRLGDDFKQVNQSRPKDERFLNLEDENGFLICVGTIEARKNHTLLYYTYKLAKRRGVHLPKMVIVGRLGWLSSDIYEIMTKDPEVNDDFVFLHNINDEELAYLYGNCMFSVYPSFYEGWGLPIAESIARGVPVVASNSSSMPEIAGELIDYFDPYSPEDCLKAVQELLKPGMLDKAKNRIKAYKLVSWDQTYQEVKESIEDLNG